MQLNVHRAVYVKSQKDMERDEKRRLELRANIEVLEPQILQGAAALFKRFNDIFIAEGMNFFSSYCPMLTLSRS